jgi:hypothetical protein
VPVKMAGTGLGARREREAVSGRLRLRPVAVSGAVHGRGSGDTEGCE